MLDNIIISTPVREDAAGSIEVQYRAWLKAYPNAEYGITIDDIEDRYKDSTEKLNKRLRMIENPAQNEKFIVAKDVDTVVGMCSASIEDKVNQLRAIYILPEYQGKGLGTKLWNEIKKFFDKNKDVILEVVEYNKNAINFYKKIGFIDTGEKFTDERFRMKSGVVFPEIRMKLDKNLI